MVFISHHFYSINIKVMKKISTSIAFVLITILNMAQTNTIKLHSVIIGKTDKNAVKSQTVGKELNNFIIPEGENTLRMYVQTTVADFKKVKVQNKLHLIVKTMDKGNELIIHDWVWPALTKNQVLSTNCYFSAGDYTINLVDNDNPTTVFATRSISVKPNAVKASSTSDGFAYDRNKFKIWTCKSVDDNWKAIGQTSKIKAGTCINLFFESTIKIKNKGSMRWGIFKIKANGTEEYVNQLDQGIGALDEWRRLAYEECNAFATPGKYRIYISTKDDADAYYAVNNKNYYAKVDLTVE